MSIYEYEWLLKSKKELTERVTNIYWHQSDRSVKSTRNKSVWFKKWKNVENSTLKGDCCLSAS